MAASSCAAIANGLVPAFKLERPRAGFSQPRAAAPRFVLYFHSLRLRVVVSQLRSASPLTLDGPVPNY